MKKWGVLLSEIMLFVELMLPVKVWAGFGDQDQCPCNIDPHGQCLSCDPRDQYCVEDSPNPATDPMCSDGGNYTPPYFCPGDQISSCAAPAVRREEWGNPLLSCYDDPYFDKWDASGRPTGPPRWHKLPDGSEEYLSYPKCDTNCNCCPPNQHNACDATPYTYTFRSADRLDERCAQASDTFISHVSSTDCDENYVCKRTNSCYSCGCVANCVDAAPSKPILASPANLATLATPTVTLSWNAVSSWGKDCATQTNTYQVFVWEKNTSVPTTPTATTTASVRHYSFTGQRGKTYRWKIIANNSALTNSSVVREFTVNSVITGKIQLDGGALAGAGFCTQANSLPLTPTSFTLSALNGGISYQASFSTTNPGDFTIDNNSAINNYTVTLDLSHQTGGKDYVCSCPAPLDPNNPYLCRYSGVSSSASNVNFYLQEKPLVNSSWFQIFGGNAWSANQLSSLVPYPSCLADNSCQPAIFVPPVGSTNQQFSGFPMTSLPQTTGIDPHDYLHLSTRVSNRNSYATDVRLEQLGYSYFMQLVGGASTSITGAMAAKPTLDDLTTSSWWKTTEANYVHIRGDVSLDETQGFNLTSDQQLVFLIDGNLTINDSNPSDTNRQITSVAGGGFLAFLVSGDIYISPHVGYELNPLAPSVPTVSVNNSQLVGVFVATNNLILGSKTELGETLPDKKFIGAGTFVGWNSILLNRSFGDETNAILNNNQAVENFIYRPDLLANWPTKLKASLSNWQEVSPQLITQ